MWFQKSSSQVWENIHIYVSTEIGKQRLKSCERQELDEIKHFLILLWFFYILKLQ